MDLSQVSNKRVFVGLSGGVDSAVTAALLKEAGADVVGVFLKGWYPPGMPCTWASDRQDAMRVAAHLGVPFITVDASKEYKEGVIDYLVSEYRAGRTPNPDIMCNREVKFGAFRAFIQEHGGGLIATGHYARILGRETAQLARGVDAGKDQSYFLWAIPKKVLSELVLPIGEYHKEAVRSLAQSRKLPVSDKPDSQGICFLGTVSVEDFLKREFGEDEGVAVDEHGAEIGRHNGVLLHTIGERISLREAAPGPWYVLGKDIERNQLVVGHDRKLKTRGNTALELTELNMLVDEVPHTDISAQYRYHGPSIAGRLSGSVFVPLEPLHEEVASGQSLVLYDGDMCLGGGIIA